MSELSFESVLIQVKAALQANGIKLWEPPFYIEIAPNETEMIVSHHFVCINAILFQYSFSRI
jgi:hypothetical protein